MKIFTTLFFAVLFTTASFAQVKTKTAVISTPGMQCDMCKGKVEKSLFKQYGIVSYKVDLKKKTTTVTWITDRTDIEQVKTMIANAGYDADDVAANEEVYAKLPACCKKPEKEDAKQ